MQNSNAQSNIIFHIRKQRTNRVKHLRSHTHRNTRKHTVTYRTPQYTQTQYTHSVKYHTPSRQILWVFRGSNTNQSAQLMEKSFP